MTNTLAHRRVIGVLVPWFNSVVEPELADLRPSGVSNQTARFAVDAGVLDNVKQAAESLLACGPEAFVIGLAAESFPGGLDLMKQGADDLNGVTGLPVFTASHAGHAALRALKVSRVAVVTPFDAAGNAHVRAALEQQGFEVPRIEGLACPSFDTIAQSRLEDVRRLFHEVDGPDVEGLLQVGTGLPVLHLVDEMERTFGKPVIASNQASYWQALRATGIDDRIAGFGRLFEKC